MSTTLPHAPAALKSLQADPRVTPAGLLDEHLNVQPSHADVLRRAEEAGYRTDDSRKSRWAAQAWIDDGVGAVLQKLSELNLSDRTMVMYASDNGTRGKMTCYGDAVPCIIRWSGAHGGRVSDELVSNIDFAPTMYELCGVTPPAGVPMDGRSLLPLLTQSSAAWRDSLYLEITYTRAVMTKDWKYVAIRYPASIQQQITPENRREFSQEGTRISAGSRTNEHVRYHADKDFPGYYDADQLYDLRNDPMEQKNLALDPRYGDALKIMKQKMVEYSKNLPHRFGEFTG
jgi:arylsulfatase A-like enzyme